MLEDIAVLTGGQVISEDIGIKLAITPRTVKFHMDSARTKMCAANRQEAVALAVKAGLFDVLP